LEKFPFLISASLALALAQCLSFKMKWKSERSREEYHEPSRKKETFQPDFPDFHYNLLEGKASGAKRAGSRWSGRRSEVEK
jgi:hypothetical protein